MIGKNDRFTRGSSLQCSFCGKTQEIQAFLQSKDRCNKNVTIYAQKKKDDYEDKEGEQQLFNKHYDSCPAKRFL